jgi:hypothetical protein
VQTFRRGTSAIRVWVAPSAPAGIDDVPPGTVTAEWRSSRVGHPSTYGLLGARLSATGAPPTLLGQGEPFTESLAGIGDRVTFGLDARERAAVTEAAPGLRLVLAGQGRVGSSPVVFFALGRFLGRLVDSGTSPTEDAAWSAWDAAAMEARAWADRRHAEREA